AYQQLGHRADAAAYEQHTGDGSDVYEGHEFHPHPHAPQQDYDGYAQSHTPHEGEHDFAPSRPSSAPFPPPIPVPDGEAGWAPPPSSEYAADERQPYPAQRASAPPAPYPGQSARPSPPPLAPWPEPEHDHGPAGYAQNYHQDYAD